MRQNFNIPIQLMNADFEHSLVMSQISDDMSDNCMGYSIALTNNIKAYDELYLDDEEDNIDYEEY